jgi:hypothetical protein
MKKSKKQVFLLFFILSEIVGRLDYATHEIMTIQDCSPCLRYVAFQTTKRPLRFFSTR